MGVKVKKIDGGFMQFVCPACNETHQVGVEPPTTVIWYYNANPEFPTFTPSILVRGVVPPTDDELAKSSYARIPRVCHSFITDGRIRYLDDCTHNMAGKTIELPDMKGN